MTVIEFIKQVKELVFDSSNSWGNVLAKFISLLVFLIVFDILLNFTYNLHVSNKLNQLEKIVSLKNTYKFDSIKSIQLNKIENEIFNKEHYSDFFLRHLTKKSLKKDINDKKISHDKTEITNTTKPIKSLFLMFFSSNYLFAIVLPFLILLPVYDKNYRTANGIAGWISGIVLLCAIMSFSTWVAYQIPWGWENPNWTYLANFLIHTLFLIFVVKFGNKRKEN